MLFALGKSLAFDCWSFILASGKARVSLWTLPCSFLYGPTSIAFELNSQSSDCSIQKSKRIRSDQSWCLLSIFNSISLAVCQRLLFRGYREQNP